MTSYFDRVRAFAARDTGANDGEPPPSHYEVFIPSTEERYDAFFEIAWRDAPRVAYLEALRAIYPDVAQAYIESRITKYWIGVGVDVENYETEEDIPDVPKWSLRLNFRSEGEREAFLRCYRGEYL